MTHADLEEDGRPDEILELPSDMVSTPPGSVGDTVDHSTDDFLASSASQANSTSPRLVIAVPPSVDSQQQRYASVNADPTSIAKESNSSHDLKQEEDEGKITKVEHRGITADTCDADVDDVDDVNIDDVDAGDDNGYGSDGSIADPSYLDPSRRRNKRSQKVKTMPQNGEKTKRRRKGDDAGGGKEPTGIILPLYTDKMW